MSKKSFSSFQRFPALRWGKAKVGAARGGRWIDGEVDPTIDSLVTLVVGIFQTDDRLTDSKVGSYGEDGACG